VSSLPSELICEAERACSHS